MTTLVPSRRAARSDRTTGSVRQSGGRRLSRLRSLARILVQLVLAAMVAVAVAGFLFLAVGPRVLGYQTSTMLTGSMAPLINPGDVVVSVPVPVTQIRTGDIITYHVPVGEHQVETHRVVVVSRDASGATSVQTKGDANNAVDPWTATLSSDTVYRHVATVPYLGTVIRFLRDPLLARVLMYGAPALLLTGGLASIWRKNPGDAAVRPGRRHGRRSSRGTHA